MTAALPAAAPHGATAAVGTSVQAPRLAGRKGAACAAALLAVAMLTGGCTPRATSANPAEAQVAVQAPFAAGGERVPTVRAANPGMASIRVSELPRQGQIVYQLILHGGPFPFDKDGDVFGNRERQLPAYPRGYYREYTVAPAHARTRGARRIVCGGAPRTPDVCYYTQDHYQSFRQIVN